MLLRNDIVEYVRPQCRIRIIWINETKHICFVINLETMDAMPYRRDLNEIIADVRAESANILQEDPYAPLVGGHVPAEKHRNRRDRAWELIAELVQDEPKVFHAGHRAKMIGELVEQGLSSRRTLYTYLRRYWQRGQTPNALLPDYVKCGGRGKERKLSDAKRGRPRLYGTGIGTNVTLDMRRVFRVAVERFYVMSKKFSLRAAYDQMIAEFFLVKEVDPKTKRIRHREKRSIVLPSIGQFRYWIRKDMDILVIRRRRERPRVYDKDFRGIIGSATAGVWGPGARFECDATVLDAYLVSRLDRKRIVGRPVLYVVIDVFSRMVVGIYVGLEGPSWVGAMMALANTVTDKVAYCEKLGISIKPEEWPCQFMPAAILADRGELESRTVESLINEFHVTIENTAPYRADWKGIVEQRFRLLPEKFKPYTPGYIDVDYRARGGRDYRLDAVLDLDQITKILIHCVLYYNNQHELASYDPDKDVAASGTPAVPLQLWEWGIENRSGSLRRFAEDKVRFSLLPREQASVTLQGIQFRGTFYTCEIAEQERWFDRARQDGRWSVKVAYDPRDMNVIYLCDQSKPTPIPCYLTERSRAAKDLSLWEHEQKLIIEKHRRADELPRHQTQRADLVAQIDAEVQEAKALKADVGGLSKAERTRSIRANRAEEKAYNREREVFRFGPGGEILSSAKDQSCNDTPQVDDQDQLDITEILGMGGDDDGR